jgi:arylsulfatase A-like enzyme
MSLTPNIILIIFDTLRRDALGVYNNKEITPYINAFSKDSVVYENCIAPAPWTIPSHASFFTGKYPSQHGVHETCDKKVSSLIGQMKKVDCETVASYLRNRGYVTFGISANPIVCPQSGFDSGFSVFTGVDEKLITTREKKAIDATSQYGRNIREVVGNLMRRGEIAELIRLYRLYRGIRKRQKIMNYPLVKGGDRVATTISNISIEQPFFMFINLFEAHDPYTSYELSLFNNMPTQFADQFGVSMADLLGIRRLPSNTLNEIRQNYYLEAGYLDTFFGTFLRSIKDKKLYDDSLIIVTSDHGQALKERNYYGHGIFLYDEILEVPLIVKYPKNNVFSSNRGYQNLVDIPLLIKSVVEGETTSDNITKSITFSESFGVPQKVLIGSQRENLDKVRRAVFKDGYKLVVDFPDGMIEEFTYKKRPVNLLDKKEKLESMRSELDLLADTQRSQPHETSEFQPEEELEIMDKLQRLGYF